MGQIAVVAALPREVAGLVGRTRPDAELRRRGIYLHRLTRALVVYAGMGTDRATLAVRAALDTGVVAELISTGLAGGCNPAVAVGTVLEAGVVVDALSGECLQLGMRDEPGARLVTTHSIAGVREKQRLHASYGADMVDMEAATVARLAGMHGLPCRVIKGISDAHDFELAALGRFSTPHGHFRTGAFALHTALRPHRWRHAMQLGSGSQRALRALNERLKEICQ